MGETQQIEQWVIDALRAGTALAWRWDLPSDEVEWCGAIEHILGVRPESLHLTDTLFQQLVHPDDREHLRRAVDRALRKRSSFEAEYRIVRPDGGIRWLREWARVTTDEAGEPLSVLGLARDISERKVSEDDLRRDEAWFRGLTQHSQDIITVVAADGRIRYSSPSGAEILGYEYGAMDQRNILDLVHPEDAATATAHMERLRKEGGQRRAEFRVRAGDGSWQTHEVLGTNLLDDPIIRGIVLNSRDVTDRRRTEQALRESEQRFRLMTERASDVLHVQDEKGKILYITPSVRYVLGHSADEVVGRTANDFLHPDDRALALRVRKECLYGSGSHPPAPLRLRHRNGSWKIVETSGSRISEEGSPPRIAFYSRDVTEARRTEAILHRQALIFRTMSEAVVMTDPHGAITEWNPAAERMFGYSRDEVMGGPVDLVLRPEDQHVLNDLEIDLEWAGELELIRRDGTVVMCDSVITALVDDEGKVTGAMAVHRDITDRKRAEEAVRRSEELFRSLIEHATDMITVVGPDGKIRYGSNSVERILGYSLENVRGRAILDFVHPNDRQGVAESLRHRTETPGVGTPRQFRLRHSDGSWRWVEARADNLIDQPAVQGIMITARDVTERYAMEEQIRQMQKLESVGRLAGGVAHDFNNLLTGIVGHAELLVADIEEGTEQHDDLKAILHASDRAAGLTRQLLAFSRKQVLRSRVINLNEVVRSSEDMLRRLIEANVALIAEPAEDLWSVRADPGQMEQVLLNLVVNARDALPAGGAITIRTRNAEAARSPDLRSRVPPGEYVVITVSDTGVGMDEDTLANAFEPFFTTKAVGKGTGLGLATVYGIVRQSGGYLWAESEVGQGSTFTICLPRETAAVEHVEPAVEERMPRGSGTILVAEDEPAVRSLVTRTLDAAGYSVLEAGDGAEALKVARAHEGPIDLLLTDVMMPGMVGTTLAGVIRVERPDTAILFMTGYSESIVGEQSGSADGFELLQKPFSPAELLKKLRAILEQVRA